ncbi:serpin-ZX-like [Mercurialis annua]|uniref:serpin-ZX-like n=1 Tax=Mercurialis annua TaxID=3986 RepID=UPI00215E0E7C|nr:serpin-ZX-like [Mercurialis annua]
METDPSPMEIDTVMNNNLEFGMRMARHIILKEITNGCKNNIVVSPLSLHAMLNLVASGTKGRTLEQLLSFLESDSIEQLNAQSSQIMELTTTSQESLESENVELSSTSSNQGPIISFVGGIWVYHELSIKPSFKQLAEDVYKAKAESVDFVNQAEKVREEVNEWASKATKGLIKDLLPHGFFRSDTILALANALYFKGTWLHEFDTSRTRNEDFHLLDGKTVKAPFMMSYSSTPQFYGSFDGFKLLKLPYKTGRKDDNIKQYSMFIFLPDKEDGLKDLIHKFNSDSSFLHKNWDLWQVELSKMWIPKFKFSYKLNALPIMKELGLKLLFERHLEVSEIVDYDDVVVTQAIHKAFIDVNEEGTSAAAVTLVSGVFGFSGPKLPPPPSFVADHPFMFMIKEETSGIVLFAGAVLNPL